MVEICRSASTFISFWLLHITDIERFDLGLMRRSPALHNVQRTDSPPPLRCSTLPGHPSLPPAPHTLLTRLAPGSSALGTRLRFPARACSRLRNGPPRPVPTTIGDSRRHAPCFMRQATLGRQKAPSFTLHGAHGSRRRSRLI